jgi:hypothetical protein
MSLWITVPRASDVRVVVEKVDPHPFSQGLSKLDKNRNNGKKFVA